MAIIQLEQIDQRNGPINRLLHSDALQLVFDALLPPPGFLSISIQATPNRPWILQLRTFKAVVLVCKRWYTLCLRYLYGDICLRYVGQVAALVRTVRTEPLTFAPLVRSLRVICYIPNEHMRVCAEGLKYLLDTFAGGRWGTVYPSTQTIAEALETSTPDSALYRFMFSRLLKGVHTGSVYQEGPKTVYHMGKYTSEDLAVLERIPGLLIRLMYESRLWDADELKFHPLAEYLVRET